MKQYIAFLRGINISGKNKVSMAELKEGFEKLDFGDVKTYLNSGNVIFSGDEDEDETFTNQDVYKRQGKDGKSLQKLFSCGNLSAQTDETGFGIGIYPHGVPRGG